MNEDERDIVEFTDEEGNSILLEVLDTFFYNGQEYAVLGDAGEDEEETCECEACECEEHEDGCTCEECEGECEGEDVYLMKIETSTDEKGEEVEEFIPVEDEDLMEKLIEIVQTRFSEDEDDEEDGEGDKE